MAFRFRREPWTSNLLIAALIACAFAVGATDAFAELWARLVGSLSDRVLLAGGLMVLHTVLFWPIALAFHAVDSTDRPAWIARHRTQKTGRKHPDLPTTLKVLLRNQFLILPLLLVSFTELILALGWTAEPELPTAWRLAGEVLFVGVSGQIVFYAAHRFLHRKWWMKRVHRIHHEFRSTTAFASEYAHPFEFVVGNFGALAAGPLLIQPHLASIYLYSTLALVTILVHHSGYALPWAPWSIPHDWHHYRFKEIFGTTGLIDRLLGTDAEFRTLEEGDI